MKALKWALGRSGFVILDRMLWIPGAHKIRNLAKRAAALFGIATASELVILAQKVRESENVRGQALDMGA